MMAAEQLILNWCRSKPRGYGNPCMRERRDGTCMVTDVLRNDGLLWSGPTWEAVAQAMAQTFEAKRDAEWLGLFRSMLEGVL